MLIRLIAGAGDFARAIARVFGHRLQFLYGEVMLYEVTFLRFVVSFPR